MATFQSLPGFREFYPEECAARNGLFRAWRDAARRFGFSEYDVPVLEPLELYQEKSGEEIKQQLFEFTDKGGRNVAMRPEMTPSLARMVAARAGSLRRPIKWFSIGEQYRYEKPQKGRLRSFYQFNADIIGEHGPAADAECIALVVEALKTCGLKQGEFEIRISDRKFWFFYLESFGLNEAQIIAALSIVDKWEREEKSEIQKKLKPLFGDKSDLVWDQISQLLKQETPGIDLMGLGPAVTQRHVEWQQLLTCLSNLGLDGFYRFDLGIVRGLAYYTGFVFEAFQTIGSGRALAGGGRYDNLIQKFGGPDLPAVGVGIGDVTVTDLLGQLKRPIATLQGPDVYVVMGEGDDLRKQALGLISKLREGGISVDYPLKETSFGKQFKAADQSGANLALILGLDEAKSGQVKIKDMKAGEEKLIANDACIVARVNEALQRAASR